MTSPVSTRELRCRHFVLSCGAVPEGCPWDHSAAGQQAPKRQPEGLCQGPTFSRAETHPALYRTHRTVHVECRVEKAVFRSTACFSSPVGRFRFPTGTNCDQCKLRRDLNSCFRL